MMNLHKVVMNETPGFLHSAQINNYNKMVCNMPAIASILNT